LYTVSLAVMLKTVVSVGLTRLFKGIGLGAGDADRLAIVVVVTLERFMRLASGSVPVFTDQRSTPHVAATTVEPQAIDRYGTESARARTNVVTCRA
jgi:hypothetical protein